MLEGSGSEGKGAAPRLDPIRAPRIPAPAAPHTFGAFKPCDNRNVRDAVT